jgi:hypothetical protein
MMYFVTEYCKAPPPQSRTEQDDGEEQEVCKLGLKQYQTVRAETGIG